MDNTNDKLKTLRKREAALKAAIATEQVKQQKARAKLEAREFLNLGEVLCKYAGQSPEFKTMLRQVMPTAIAAVGDDATRKVLTMRGWL